MAFIAQGNKKKKMVPWAPSNPQLWIWPQGRGLCSTWQPYVWQAQPPPLDLSAKANEATQESSCTHKSKTCTSKQDFSRFSENTCYLSQLSPKCRPGWLTTVLSCLNWSWVNFAFEKLVSCARKKDSEAGLCFMCVPFWFLKENKRVIASLSKTLSGFDSITVFSNTSSVMYGFDVLCDTRCN